MDKSLTQSCYSAINDPCWEGKKEKKKKKRNTHTLRLHKIKHIQVMPYHYRIKDIFSNIFKTLTATWLRKGVGEGKGGWGGGLKKVVGITKIESADSVPFCTAF